MSDKSIAEIVEAKNAKNVSAYQQAAAEYKKAFAEDIENLEPPIMSATVGGIKFEKSAIVNVPIVAKNQETITSKLPCPTEEEVSFMAAAIRDGATIKNFTSGYDISQINDAMFDELIRIAPRPVTILDVTKVTEEGILQQCINNFEGAGEAAKLPRKTMTKPARL